MGIRIDGASDLINATDGSLTIEGQSINSTGIGTFSGGVKVGSAATIHSTGQFNIGVAATVFPNGNATFAGIVTASRLGNTYVSSQLGIGAAAADYQQFHITAADPRIRIQSSGTNAAKIQFADSGSGDIGVIEYSHSDNSMRFNTASAEMLRITSAGHVGVTSASPTATRFSGTVSGLLNVAGTKPCVYISETDSKDSSGTDRALYWGVSGGTAYGGSNADFVLGTGDTGTTERLRIRTDGRVAIASSLAVTGVCTAAQFVPTHVGGATGRRNMVINGACLVSQRYGTSSVGTDGYPMDMFRVSMPGGHSAVHQIVNDGPTDATSGFQYSLKITNDNSVNNPTSSQTAYLQMDSLEASTVAHLNAGTASAKKVTLSFWVKSSQTGTWGLAFGNTTSGYYTSGNTNRSYVTRYTVDATGTWEKKSITITLDTGGTWAKTGTGGGLSIVWDLGSGGSHQGSENTWAANDNIRASGFKNIGDAANATWQITGIQLELGDTATPFEHETYGDTLARCQRYLFKSVGRPTAAGRGAGSSAYLAALPIPVPFRTDPTISSGTDSANGSFNIRVYKYDGISDSTTTPTIGTRGSIVDTNWVTIYQENHSVTDDRVLSIYQGGGYLLFDAKI